MTGLDIDALRAAPTTPTATSCAGDLLFSGCAPHAPQGTISGWIAVSDEDPPGSPPPREQVLLGMMALNGGHPLTFLA